MTKNLNIELKGNFSPAFVHWPEVANIESKACGVIPQSDDQITFQCFSASNDKWNNLSDKSGLISSQITAQPSIAYHRPRKEDGSPSGLFGSPGQFWVAYHTASNMTFIMRSKTVSTNANNTPESFSATNPMFWIDNAKGIVNLPDTRKPGSSISLYEDPLISSLKGAYYLRGTDDDTLRFLPFVDGTFRSHGLRGGNDFRIMERGICWGLQSVDYPSLGQNATRADTFCGTSSNNIWGY